MSDVILVGTDASLLEGLSQTLGAVGSTTEVAASVMDALRKAAMDPPLLVVIDRECIGSGADLLRMPLARGGALILYRTGDWAFSTLPAGVQRAVLADLLLPLERARLVALLHTISERSRQVGGDRPLGPPEAPRDA